MTAAHVLCEEGQQMEVSLDHGRTWEEVPPAPIAVTPDIDMAVVRVPGKLPTPAQFRSAVDGEPVTDVGMGMGIGMTTVGNVMRVLDDLLIASNLPVAGQSGSALVGEDGKVVGMTIWNLTLDKHITATGAVPARDLSFLWEAYKKA